MKNTEFTSQICTTREQSQRLLDMGLKPETADMVYHFTGSSIEAIQWELQTKPPTLRGEFWTEERIAHLARRGESGEEVFDKLWGKDVPAWSLSRLMDIMPNVVFENKKPGKPHHPELIKGNSGYILSIRRHTADCLVGTYMENTPIECCVSMIEWLIRNNYFNKNYLQ